MLDWRWCILKKFTKRFFYSSMFYGSYIYENKTEEFRYLIFWKGYFNMTIWWNLTFFQCMDKQKTQYNKPYLKAIYMHLGRSVSIDNNIIIVRQNDERAFQRGPSPPLSQTPHMEWRQHSAIWRQLKKWEMIFLNNCWWKMGLPSEGIIVHFV